MRSAIALAFLVGCAPQPGAPLETWNGVTAYVFGDREDPIYARSGSDASFASPGIETDRIGFQCVELAVRYLYFNKGVGLDWHGENAADLCADHPDALEVVASPEVGDLMVFAANDAAYEIGVDGHVAIIRDVDGAQVGLFTQRWGDESTALVDGIAADHAECLLRAR